MAAAISSMQSDLDGGFSTVVKYMGLQIINDMLNPKVCVLVVVISLL